MNPFPNGPEHRNQQTLRVPRRYVDQKIANLPAAHRLKMLDDGINVPVRYEDRARFDDAPRLTHEFGQATRGKLAVNLLNELWSLQQGYAVV